MEVKKWFDGENFCPDGRRIPVGESESAKF
jgi:hypothetical protein